MNTLSLPKYETLEVAAVYKPLTDAHRHLAELKGLCESLPNNGILFDTLGIQEAKDSSEIENIITTHDEVYSYDNATSGAAKEVLHYRSALRLGYQDVLDTNLILLRTILRIQQEIEGNRAGLRKQAGTVIKNTKTNEVVYEPPQDPAVIEKLMSDLVDFIHAEDDLDPILRMAIAHHQFECIHPFYDGNGRTGRILNLLILQREGLLDLPVLYLSRYVTSTKAQYYELLSATQKTGDWVPWCAYIAKGIAVTAKSEVLMVKSLRDLIGYTKNEIRTHLPKIYSQELINNIFRYPYTKIEHMEREIKISRITAARYLDMLVGSGFLEKRKIGRSNFYINNPLFKLLTNIQLEL